MEWFYYVSGIIFLFLTFAPYRSGCEALGPLSFIIGCILICIPLVPAIEKKRKDKAWKHYLNGTATKNEKEIAQQIEAGLKQRERAAEAAAAAAERERKQKELEKESLLSVVRSQLLTQTRILTTPDNKQALAIDNINKRWIYCEKVPSQVIPTEPIIHITHSYRELVSFEPIYLGHTNITTSGYSSSYRGYGETRINTTKDSYIDGIAIKVFLIDGTFQIIKLYPYYDRNSQVATAIQNEMIAMLTAIKAQA